MLMCHWSGLHRSGGNYIDYTVLPLVPPQWCDRTHRAPEVLRAAQIEVSANFNYTPYVVAALLFVLLTLPLTRLTDWLQQRSARRRSASGVS